MNQYLTLTKKLQSFAIATMTVAMVITNIPSPAQAENKDLKVAVLDNATVFEKSDVFKKINSQMKEKSDSFGEKLRKTESDLRKKLADVEKQKAALSKKALDEKSEAVSKGFVDLQQKAVAGREALQKIYEGVMKDFIGHLNGVITKVAEEESYDLVLDKNSSQYFKQKLDITDKIVKALNSSDYSIKIDFSEVDKIKVEPETKENSKK